ncbi:glycoside hydrolase [Polyplosphaeria fusca]|uniref:Glycoside hydrolase n=1 Tax=Polyplosphaeria fusca TaxID=682080 RepID=A0A9P4R4G5_9PLEO|nr:glycoside hydrolase [Polyplosphaeria fusca]
MKSIGVYATLALGALMAEPAAAHPHGKYLKRALVTEVAWTTVTVADVIIWVDEDGNPVKTETQDLTAVVPTTVTGPLITSSPIAQVVTPASAVPTSSAEYKSSATSVGTPSSSTSSSVKSSTSPPSISTSSAHYAAPPPLVTKPTSEPPASSESPATSFSAYAKPSTESPQAQPTVTPQDGSISKWPVGVTYDIYSGSGGCKSASDIATDYDKMMGNYDIVRIYGLDCDGVSAAVQKAHEHGKKIFAGAYLPQEQLQKAVDTLHGAVQKYNGGDWSIISGFSIENERVQCGDMTASGVVDTIRQAKEALKAVGYNGPVGATDTVPAVVGNPSICDAADIVFVNIHAFFDSDCRAEDAGICVQRHVDEVKKACGNKRVVITESGWPSQGEANGNAVPGRANQQAAIESLKSQFKNDIFIFSAFDTMWKADSGDTFNAEKYWGVMK